MTRDPRASARTHRGWTTAAGAALLVLGVAGCSFAGSVEDATGSPSTTTSGTSATSPSTASSSSAPTTTSGTSAPATSSQPTGQTSSPSSASPTAPTAPTAPASSTSPSSSTCRTADLALSVVADPGGASAGHQHLLVRFTNSGGGACVLDGHPGVSLVAGDDGHQVGAAASREGSPAAVRLAPGASAQAALSVAQAGDYDAGTCRPTPVRGLRVYPPDQTASAFVAVDGLTGCSATSVVLLVVDPVEAS